MKLLAFSGSLRLKDCCAKPTNEVRAATIEDIVLWLKSHPETHERIARELEALSR